MLAALLSGLARKRWVPAKGWKVLTGKEKRNFNKGKGAMKAGFLDKHANFTLVPSMLPTYKVPELTGFKLKPYVVRRPATSDKQQPEAAE